MLMDVKNPRASLDSYRNDFNAKVLNKLLKDNNLEFRPVFCGTYCLSMERSSACGSAGDHCGGAEGISMPCHLIREATIRSFLAEEVLSDV